MPIPGLELVRLSYLQDLVGQNIDQRNKYTTLRNYYDGNHATQLTARLRAFLELSPSAPEFNLNLCPIVVDALAERLKVVDFTCKDKKSADLFRDWWMKNRMDAAQGVTHTAAVRDGDTYMLVGWDEEKGRPTFDQENAFDGSQGVHIVYSDECRTEPVVARKQWITTQGAGLLVRHLNMYYPDRLLKYDDGGLGEDWIQRSEEDWLTKDGDPLGVPVFHFRNKDQGYSYGWSELDDVIPPQNLINKAVIDVCGAADSTGFRMYTMTGGNPTGVTVAPGQWLWSTNPDAKIDAIDPADLSGLLELVDKGIAYVAYITRTPLSYFQLTGNIAAAGTLKEQRSGLVSKTMSRQVDFGMTWSDAQHFARKLYNAYGPGGLDEEAEVTAVWKDDEKPDGKALAEEVEFLTRAQSASVRTKVKILHPEWSEKEIKDEVDLIKAEQGMAVPDLGPMSVPPEKVPPEEAS
jgi:hypothetical protein